MTAKTLDADMMFDLLGVKQVGDQIIIANPWAGLPTR
jgi:hypothetical protein